MIDIVIDTNVLAHAQDPDCGRFDDAFTFLAAVLMSATLLCIDKEFDPKSKAATDSLIASEYLDNLIQGSAGYAILVRLFSSERYKAVGTKVDPTARQWGVQNLKKPRDRTFFWVTINSDEKTLVTHDFEDFPQRTRAEIKKRFSGTIYDAREAREAL